MTTLSENYPQFGDDTPQKTQSIGKFFRSFLFDRNDPRLFPITQKLATISPATIIDYNIAAAMRVSSGSLFQNIAAIRKSLTEVEPDKNKQYIIIGYLVLAKLNKEVFPLPKDIQAFATTKNAEIEFVLNRFVDTNPSRNTDRITIGLLLTAALNEVLKNEITTSNPDVAKLMAQYAVAVELSKLQRAMINMSDSQMPVAVMLSMGIAMTTIFLLTAAICLLFPPFAVAPTAVLIYSIICSLEAMWMARLIYNDIKESRHQGLSEFFEEQKEQALKTHFNSDSIDLDQFQAKIATAKDKDQVMEELSDICTVTMRGLKL